MAEARNFAERNMQQANVDMMGMRDLAEQTIEQTQKAFEGLLSTTQRSVETLQEGAESLRQSTLRLAAATIANSVEFSQKLLQVKSPTDMLQLQTEFLDAQMRAFTEQSERLGQAAAEGARMVQDVAQESVNAQRSVADWTRIEQNWEKFTGKVREKWSKLTEADLEAVRGRRAQLEAKIQERYGQAREQVRKDIDAWLRMLK